MENQTNNRIREEFIEAMGITPNSNVPVDDPHGCRYLSIKGRWIADWWLSKIDELLKSQKESLVEKIKEKFPIEEDTRDETDIAYLTRENRNLIRNKIISLIKEDK